MIILGVDPGLLHTGYGVIRKNDDRLSYIDSGTISPPTKGNLSTRIEYIYNNLSQQILQHKPNIIAVEEIFVSTNSSVTLKLGHARGVILLAAAHAKTPIREFSSTAVKKAIVGFGRAEKSQIIAMLKMLLPKAQPNSEHAADALATAITCAHHNDNPNTTTNI